MVGEIGEIVLEEIDEDTAPQHGIGPWGPDPPGRKPRDPPGLPHRNGLNG